jgi:hypothetical protein
MTDAEIRKAESIVRMNDFGVSHAASFPATGLAGQMFAEMGAVVTDVETHGTAQSAGAGAARTSAGAKKAAREDLRRRMKAISATAAAMESERPGISNTFRLPKAGNDQTLLNTARAFSEAAVPLRSEFTERELPASFIEDLNAAVAEFENAVNAQNISTEKRVSATAALKDALARGMKLKRELDPIVRNKFHGDPATLAAWTSASHVERAPRAKPAPPAPQPTASIE